MTPDRVFEDYYPQLQSVVTKIMCHITNFSMLFSLVSTNNRCGCIILTYIILLKIVMPMKIYKTSYMKITLWHCTCSRVIKTYQREKKMMRPYNTWFANIE